MLLGTGTYWEGISVEGIALSNLIIFRLPFPAPEPIIDSRVGEKSKAKYKQMIWDALPIKNKTSNIEKIKKFYNLFKGNNNLKKND